MGNNYIVTIPSDVLDLNLLTWKELRAVDFAFDSPFKLKLADDQYLVTEEIVRIVPGKRIVAFGTWQGKSIVAKLFFDGDAKRHMEEDADGVKLLREHKIPTPPLYYQGYSPDKRVYVLLFQRIYEASGLGDIWRDKKNITSILPILQGVTVELATQHVLGILQHDLHLNNFLLTRKTIYTLDGAQVELVPQLLPRKLSIENLALFFSQFGVGHEEYHEKLFKHYAKARGWLLKPEDTVELFLAVKKWNDERWNSYEQKIFRECTAFGCIDTWNTFGIYDRKAGTPEFSEFLKNPDSAFSDPTTVMLKDGRSATVVKVTYDNRDYVVKRYNIKNMRHRLRRAIRRTRASMSWRLAQKFTMFGIPTAKPIAFIEKKWLGFRGKSYYVTEYVSSEHAGDYFASINPEKITEMVKQIGTLLKNIAKVEVTHGDLKITNILIDANKKPILIDLDGAAEHSSLSSLRSAWRKEIKRFLRNFDDKPLISKQFKAELGEKS